ncbi:MAG: D-alanyl-D-alanine carboxypeptidase [Gammaproteobacteria bacterium]|nr:D-alanyl-D-alanine carboxypeptidase [Gammaproteobacteria bacterium]
MNFIKLPIAALLLALVTIAQAAAPSIIPSPPSLATTGYLLMDYQSGQVIAEENATQRLEPASLTKMMTAYVVSHELDSGHITLEDKVRVSEKAWRMPGSRMFIEVGTTVSVEQLLKGLIIQSGNDASVALAEHVAGSEESFVPLMNAHAKRLGLSGTQFANSTGLPHPEHYTTPQDMARLAAAIIRDFPGHYAWYAEKSYAYNGISQNNRNLLLFRDESVDGLKTGHTEAAGYCLVASAMREQMRLISVVMGTKSEKARTQESQKLLNYGFRFYETHRLYGAAQELKEMRIWKGEGESLKLGLQDELYVTVPRGQYKQLNASLNVDKTITAPASRGQPFGSVQIHLGEQLLAERPLIALHDVAEGGVLQRLKDSVLLLLQ